MQSFRQNHFLFAHSLRACCGARMTATQKDAQTMLCTPQSRFRRKEMHNYTTTSESSKLDSLSNAIRVCLHLKAHQTSPNRNRKKIFLNFFVAEKIEERYCHKCKRYALSWRKRVSTPCCSACVGACGPSTASDTCQESRVEQQGLACVGACGPSWVSSFLLSPVVHVHVSLYVGSIMRHRGLRTSCMPACSFLKQSDEI